MLILLLLLYNNLHVEKNLLGVVVMKVVFLDVDGVLNTEETFERNYQEYLKTGIKNEPIDEIRIGYLKEIVDKTGAKIVLSSSWRRHCEFEDGLIVSEEGHTKYLIKMLAKYGMTLYDITGYDREGNRGNEINEWLNQNEVENFIILDDSSGDLQDFIDKELIKTNFYKGENSGLCQEHIDVAIDKLNSVRNKVLVRSRNENNIQRSC